MSYLAGLALAAALTSVPHAGEAQRLGRLFSTPEERALLDELRRDQRLVEPEPQSVVDMNPEVPMLEQVTIDGVVLRSSGANSAWINGQQVSGGARTRDGVRVDASAAGDGQVKITLPSGADTIDLKPGQKIDVNSGVVLEAYERADGSRGYSVFNRVSSDSDGSLGQIPGSTPQENAPVQEREAPAGPGGVQYPEAFLERIRRALQGN
ncbi:MAG: hypothetical protein OER43_02720 [Gammaproteobacteria bacterium]|nr:hypothetical protein [Gammaproteobacteria bacterium]MDH3414485.1 hypothetical protein [Gammaproteobacteria bacterium]